MSLRYDFPYPTLSRKHQNNFTLIFLHFEIPGSVEVIRPVWELFDYTLYSHVSLSFCNSYRRLSLSQSPGDQTKCFELSVVWDSQFATSFTLYMYTDCLDHRDNLHVHVFGNDILKFKYPLTELLISDTNFEKAVSEIKKCWWLLTSKNAFKQCSITKVTKATPCTLWV